MTNVILGAVIACFLSLVGGFWAGYMAGEDKVKAKLDAEKVAAFVIVEQARKEIANIEQQAEAELRTLSDVYTKEIGRRDDAAAATRRELDRLRLALSAAPRDSQRAENPDPRPEVDGSAPVAGNLLAECAAELVEMGRHAERLAGQVMGLQGYIRTIQEMH